MMKFVGWSILFALVMTACAPAKRGEESSVTTTYSPQKPVVSKEGSHDVVHGATQIDNMSTQYDASVNGLLLKGKVKVTPLDGASPFEVELSVLGKADKQGFVVMKPGKDQPSLPPEVKVGVKATCLGEKLACNSSFIDIYIQYRGKIYHHQVESHEEPTLKVPEKGAVTTPATPAAPSPAPKEEKKSEVTPPAPKKKEEVAPAPATAPKASAEADEGEDEEDEGTEDTETHGRYVGDIQGDIEKVLNETGSQAGPAKLDQVVGQVNHGRLEKASNLLNYERNHVPAGFHVVNPGRERYYGSAELIYLIANMGKYTQQLIPRYVLPIGDLSRKTGGKLGLHASHQNGLDVDIAFYFKDPSLQGNLFSALNGGKTGSPVTSWRIEEQWKLFKYAVNSKYVDRIFIHQTLKKSLCQYAIKSGELTEGQSEGLAYETLRRLRPEKNHYNHFHMRVKCSKSQVRCRQMAEPPAGSGCF